MSEWPLIGDIITQRELASQLIFQNAEYSSRASLLKRYSRGAQIEPGPLTIVKPYFDLGPFIIASSEATRRAEQVRQYILDAALVFEKEDFNHSASEFSHVSQQITARVWEAVLERRKLSLQARNWCNFRMSVRDHLYACEVTWMLWVAARCAACGCTWLGRRAFGVASIRAVALAYV